MKLHYRLCDFDTALHLLICALRLQGLHHRGCSSDADYRRHCAHRNSPRLSNLKHNLRLPADLVLQL